MADINLKLTLNNNGSITANWIVLPGVTKQRVDFWEVGKSYGIEVNDDWHGSSYTTKANLPANKQYYFKVSEIGNGITLGGDRQKILIRADFYDNQPMGVPQNIIITPATKQIAVRFDAVARAQSYDILFDNNIYNVTQTSKTFTGLTPNTSHTIAIRAKGSKLTGAYSATQTVKTLPISPAVPSGIKKTATETSATISWNKVSGAVSYDILFNGSTYNTTTTSRTFTGLTAGRSYAFQVRARNADVAGSYTNQMTVATPAKPPATVTATSTGDSITVSWSKVDGVAGYLVRCVKDDTITTASTTSVKFTDLKPKTSYTYQVACRSLDGEGSFSPAKTIRTLAKMPSIPAGIAGETTENSVTVRWDAVSDATGYDVWFNGSTYSTTTPKAPAAVTETPSRTDITLRWDPVSGATSYDVLFDGTTYRVTGTSKTISGLKADTSYRYQVRTNNENGSSSYSPVKTIKTLPYAPSTYPTVKATATADSVTLSWNSVSGATEYELIFGQNTYTVKGTSHKITGLKDDTSYNYRIRSCNAGGYSSYSPYAAVKTLLKVPDVPTSITAKAYSDSVRVSWMWVSKADSYDLYFNGTVYNTSSSSYTVNGLRPNTSYSYQVRAKNSAGNGAYSARYSVRTLVAKPAVPANVRATATTNSVTVAWNSVSGATGYKLLFNGETYSLTGTSKTITGLTPDTEYEYAVCASNAGGNSAYTARQTITTIAVGPAVPSGVTAKAGLNSVIVSFPPVEGAVDYDIRIDGVICHISGEGNMVDGRICKVFPGLDPNTEHTYGVRANNDEGSSRFSTQETITTAISKDNGLAERSTDSTYTDGKISYTGNDPVNVLTGAFLWSYTYLEGYGKDRLHFTLMYDSDRDTFDKAVGVKWSYALHYLLHMDEDYAYFVTPYGAVIPFAKEAAFILMTRMTTWFPGRIKKKMYGIIAMMRRAICHRRRIRRTISISMYTMLWADLLPIPRQRGKQYPITILRQEICLR